MIDAGNLTWMQQCRHSTEICSTLWGQKGSMCKNQTLEKLRLHKSQPLPTDTYNLVCRFSATYHSLAHRVRLMLLKHHAISDKLQLFLPHPVWIMWQTCNRCKLSSTLLESLLWVFHICREDHLWSSVSCVWPAASISIINLHHN